MMSSKTSNMPRAVRRAGIFTAQGYQSKLWPNSSSGIFSISVSGASSSSANSILCSGRRQNDCRNRSWLASMFDWARHRSRLRNCSAPLPRCAPPAAAPAVSLNFDAPLDTPHSVPAAGVDIPRRASLCNYCLRVSPAHQQRCSLTGWLRPTVYDHLRSHVM